MCGINAIYAYRDGAPPIDGTELIASRECMHARDGKGSRLAMRQNKMSSNQ